MKRNLVLVSLALICSFSAAAQDKGYWRANSQNANSITGDIAIADAKMTIDFLVFPIAQIRALTPVEISAVFDADGTVAQAGNLYRVNIPAGQHFLKKNTLCGTEDTQWMATWIDGRNLHVAFFSGANMPVFKFEAITNSTDVCGSFTYSR